MIDKKKLFAEIGSPCRISQFNLVGDKSGMKYDWLVFNENNDSVSVLTGDNPDSYCFTHILNEQTIDRILVQVATDFGILHAVVAR